MSFTQDDIQSLAGGTVVGSDGEKIGEVSQFYLSDSTGEPTWATVRTGLFGSQESFVPLSGARAESGELHVQFDKATVKDAPRVDADGHLEPDEEENLYRYYGVGDDADRTGEGDRLGRSRRPRGPDRRPRPGPLP